MKAFVTGYGCELGRMVVHKIKLNNIDVLTHTRTKNAGSDFCGDLCDEMTIAKIANSIDEVDFLVCCHGGHKSKDTIKNMLDDNLISTINICNIICRSMVIRKFGRVVIVGSYAGCFGQPNGINYSISKAALHQYTRCMASSHRDSNVYFNCIAVGNMSDSESIDTVSTESVSDIIIDLLTQSCINGQIIRIDKGKHTFPC